MRQKIQNINPDFSLKSEATLPYFFEKDGLEMKSSYTENDSKVLTEKRYSAGIVPYLRGPYSTMYVQKPWTIRQYAGFSTAEESNAFYRRNLAADKKVCPLLLIWRHIVVTILIIQELKVMLEKPVLRLIPWKT